MDKGTVLFYKSFIFHDGETSDKRIILLNEPDDNQPYLCCKTTSKEKFGLHYEGCYSDKNIYIINPIPECFKLKTWIQFHELYEIDHISFISAKLKGDIDIKGILNKETITSIIECIRNSDDITNYQLSLLG